MNRQVPIFLLEYLPLLIRLECKETTRLPAFLGSTLHGVTGWALTRHSESYTYVFENRRLGVELLRISSTLISLSHHGQSQFILKVIHYALSSS